MHEELHCYVHPVPNFQIIIVNGRMIKCGRHHENVKIQLGDYNLKTHMLSIDIGGCDIVLRGNGYAHGPVTLDFKELFLSFNQDSHCTHAII